jgi:hypothetical protein
MIQVFCESYVRAILDQAAGQQSMSRDDFYRFPRSHSCRSPRRGGRGFAAVLQTQVNSGTRQICGMSFVSRQGGATGRAGYAPGV